MAATTAALCFNSVNGMSSLASNHGALLNAPTLGQSGMGLAPMCKSIRSRLYVRAAADGEDPRKQTAKQTSATIKDFGKLLQNSVEGTKQTVNEATIRDNMENNLSEKKSVLGAEPSSGSFYPRPEIERRPETGERSFQSVLAFDGAAPETINGRLAMIGLFWGAVAEMSTHKPILQQLFDPSGFTDGFGRVWFILAASLVIGASLIPIFNGESTDSRRFAAFTAKAERWNGRLAMIGFAGLILVEFALDHSFF